MYGVSPVRSASRKVWNRSTLSFLVCKYGRACGLCNVLHGRLSLNGGTDSALVTELCGATAKD